MPVRTETLRRVKLQGGNIFYFKLFGPKSMGNRFLQDIISCISLFLELLGSNRQN